eukprot:m.231316 g.231316  ORF g.231316 m.231316 type:complete len:663 (+) comp10870_c1_seq15:47-2035(+)
MGWHVFTGAPSASALAQSPGEVAARDDIDEFGHLREWRAVHVCAVPSAPATATATTEPAIQSVDSIDSDHDDGAPPDSLSCSVMSAPHVFEETLALPRADSEDADDSMHATERSDQSVISQSIAHLYRLRDEFADELDTRSDGGQCQPDPQPLPQPLPTSNSCLPPSKRRRVDAAAAQAAVPLGKFALLAECADSRERIVDLLVVVLNTQQATVVQTRRNERVPVARLVVADHTCTNFLISLWGDKARWAERIHPPDIVFLTAISIRNYRGANSGNSTRHSRVTNFHCLEQSPQLAAHPELSQLLAHARRAHGHLFSGALESVSYTELANLQGSTMVHLRAAVSATPPAQCEQVLAPSSVVWLVDSTAVPPVPLILAEPSAAELRKTLIAGPATTRAQSSVAATYAARPDVHELRYVRVYRCPRTGAVRLFPTSKTTQRLLPPTAPEAMAVVARVAPSAVLFPSVATMRQSWKAALQGKFRVPGIVKSIRVKGEARQRSLFQTLGAGAPLVFTGCSTCRAPMQPDASGVFMPCRNCLRGGVDAIGSPTKFFHTIQIEIADARDVGPSLSVLLEHEDICSLLTLHDPVFDLAAEYWGQPPALADARVRARFDEVVLVQSTLSWELSASAEIDENGFVKGYTCELVSVRSCPVALRKSAVATAS